MGALTIGVDIGQRVDPTAIAVVEAESRLHDGLMLDFHTVRFLERLPLGTPYPDVAKAIAALVRDVRSRAQGFPIRIYADATGVGLPVVDLLRAAGVPVVAVFFTYGDRRTEERDESTGHATVKLGKAWLVSRLQALLQTSRLTAPRTSETQALVDELLNYEIRIDPDGDAKFGAFKVGKHDDLVTALGLAVQDKPGRPLSAAVGGSRPMIAQYQAQLAGLNGGRPYPGTNERDQAARVQTLLQQLRN